ncbi:hypothetical protein U9M48_000349 [Paspalum notatum var. saurae]|uniref:Reverse transcriptase-like protein n=1 Tax=Paspalum notatum var. saurae TaxID=547442 RepID=A0AAQ3PM74_PASNO
MQLQSILDMYESCSGQVINREKSAVMFSKNTGDAYRVAVKRAMHTKKETVNERYLGLPVSVGQSKTKTFSYLKERVWKRIQGWKEKMLSRAGKEILIKAVAQAIPTYAMGCFDITKSLRNQISSMIARFWWGLQDNEHKIHWLSWERLVQPKEKGGLGFQDIHSFNLAMLAKQGWRIIHNAETVCARLLSAKYFPHGNILDAKPKRNMSYTWRSILQGLKLVKKGLIWRIRDGSSLNIWKDAWVPRSWSRQVITPRGHSVLTRVSNLIDPSTGTWDEELVKEIFWEEDAELILSLTVH